MSTWIRLKREIASYVSITICSKCGTRTKMKYAESVPSKTNDMGFGYTICPKCGNKEEWLGRGIDWGSINLKEKQFGNLDETQKENSKNCDCYDCAHIGHKNCGCCQ